MWSACNASVGETLNPSELFVAQKHEQGKVWDVTVVHLLSSSQLAGLSFAPALG